MLYKYLGETLDPDSRTAVPRVDCLRNGLFRITQPALLNDKMSEFRAAVYFDSYSPADYEWALQQQRRMQVGHSNQPSNDELERFFLRPTGLRYGDAFPHMLAFEGKFKTMDQYDLAQLEVVAGTINKTVVNVASALFGVLSLCEDPFNALMWTHYGAEGRGIAIGFDESHAFFQKAGIRAVSYDPSDRASISYVKGLTRLNGFRIPRQNEDWDWASLFSDPTKLLSIFEKFVFSKNDVWSYEREHRLLVPLAHRDAAADPDDHFVPHMEPAVKTILESFLRTGQPRVCLKRVPFEAFREVLIGYEVGHPVEQMIRHQLNSNSALSHVLLKRVNIDIFGNLTASLV